MSSLFLSSLSWWSIRLEWLTSIHGKEVKMLEELIIFVQQGVVCDLTREKEARFGEWSIFTQNMATFWRFCGGESNSSFQGVNILISKWQILTGRSLKPNKKLSFFLSLNLFIYSKTINWGHVTCYVCGMGIWQSKMEHTCPLEFPF